MSKLIFNKSDYSSRALETFEVMAAYFVDIYYNYLYFEAKKFKTEGKVGSITEGYKHSLNAFLQGIQKPKFVKKSLVGLHSFYTNDIGFTSMSFNNCIERMVSEFVPSDYFNSLNKNQKIGILKLIIIQSNKTFIKKIVMEYLAQIIDNHDDRDNARVLQNEFVEILMGEHQSLYHRFIASETQTNKSNPNINTAMIESMRKELKSLYKEKYENKVAITQLKKIILKKNEEHSNVDEKINEMQTEINELKSTIQDLYNELEKKKKEISNLNHKLEFSGSIHNNSNKIINEISNNVLDKPEEVKEMAKPIVQNSESISNPISLNSNNIQEQKYPSIEMNPPSYNNIRENNLNFPEKETINTVDIIEEKTADEKHTELDTEKNSNDSNEQFNFDMDEMESLGF